MSISVRFDNGQYLDVRPKMLTEPLEVISDCFSIDLGPCPTPLWSSIFPILLSTAAVKVP
jgi:hypothetical protein